MAGIARSERLGCSRPFFLALLCLLSAGSGHVLGARSYLRGQIERGQERFPAATSCEEDFSEHFPEQTGGTCHVFSAVALYEAYCKRQTGNSIDVSEAYLTYRHLRTRLESKNLLALHLPETDSITAGDDGGQAVDTLDRILKGAVCTEEEFRRPERFYTHASAYARQLERWAQENVSRFKDQATQTSVFRDCESLAQPKYCRHLDSLAKARLPVSSELTPSGYVATTQDKKLRECLRIPTEAVRVGPFKTRAQFEVHAVRLLSKSIPFVCSAESSQFYGEEGAGKSHAVVVTGYEAFSATDGGVGFDFWVRDSNGPDRRSRHDALFCHFVTHLVRRSSQPNQADKH